MSKENPLKIVSLVVLGLGLLVAVVSGLFAGIVRVETAILGLALLGGLMGICYGIALIKEELEETLVFLVGATSLLLAGVANVSLGIVPFIGVYLQAILVNITTFLAFAAIPVVLIMVVANLVRD